MADNRPVNLAVRAAPALAIEPAIRVDRFVSVLFERDPGTAGEEAAQPDFFVDLNLDQIVASLTAGRGEYELEPLLHATLQDPDAILYRQEVMQDLEQEAVSAAIKAFAEAQHEVRVKLAGAGKRYYAKQQQRWLLDAATLYDTSVEQLAQALESAALSSRGLAGVADYLSRYVADGQIAARREQEHGLLKQLGEVQYTSPEPMQWTLAGVDCRRERQRYSGADYAWSIEVVSITHTRPGSKFHLLLVAEFWRAGPVDLRSQKWLKLLSGQPADVRNWLASCRAEDRW